MGRGAIPPRFSLAAKGCGVLLRKTLKRLDAKRQVFRYPPNTRAPSRGVDEQHEHGVAQVNASVCQKTVDTL